MRTVSINNSLRNHALVIDNDHRIIPNKSIRHKIMRARARAHLVWHKTYTIHAYLLDAIKASKLVHTHIICNESNTISYYFRLSDSLVIVHCLLLQIERMPLICKTGAKFTWHLCIGTNDKRIQYTTIDGMSFGTIDCLCISLFIQTELEKNQMHAVHGS